MAEDDAVAAYLARERAALGEDADLFNAGNGGGASGGMDAFPDLDNMDSKPTPISAAPAQSNTNGNSGTGGDDFDLFSSSSPTNAPNDYSAQASKFPALDTNGGGFGGGLGGGEEVRVTGYGGAEGEGDEERMKFEESFPDIGGSGGESLTAIPYGATPYPTQSYTQQQPAAASYSYQSVLPAPTFAAAQVEEDSEPIKAWKERQREEIKKRDEESARKKEETILKAEKAIDAFYEKYNETKERSIRENKENEKTFLDNLQESISKGTSWERITELIDLQNSQSKTLRASVPGGSDLARMKEILLNLKREGEKAPAAGGY